MLVLKRSNNETIVLEMGGCRATITVTKLGRSTCRLCIEAPDAVRVARGELPPLSARVARIVRERGLQ